MPGPFYRLTFDLQPKDMVVPAGRRLAFMILSSDFEHTLRPAPGTQLTLDTAQLERLAADRRWPRRRSRQRPAPATSAAPAGGTVPATLALTLGRAGIFGAFTPGVAKEYTATTTANVISTRRRRRADRLASPAT